MLTCLATILSEIGSDDRVRVIVLKGVGRHFCTGADLNYVRAVKENGDDQAAPDALGQVLEMLDACPKPIIAAIRGACLGGGMGLAICCDVILAADDA